MHTLECPFLFSGSIGVLMRGLTPCSRDPLKTQSSWHWWYTLASRNILPFPWGVVHDVQINIYLHNHVLSQVAKILKAFFYSIPLSHSSLYQCFYWHNPVFMSGSLRRQINFRNHSILDILLRTSFSVVCSEGNLGYFQNPTSCSFVLNNLVSIFSSSCSSQISV